ncbi:hemolysin type calcium-binding protein [Thioclava sp. ES.031]|uniref:calcium-binding protein n=1 Tax=Thioclava sp. ES.031 TaxID=1798203 RepID=UPI000C01202D|nr:calcium-binding protein [Thioclava sp. ES.031]PFG63616.1 hemolysin type calcium-binding protein [Thioclava sp. ES.031]
MATQIDPSNVDDWDEPLNTDPMFRSSHVFSTADITVTFDGMTVGAAEDPLAYFDTTGTNGTKETKEGVTLYPIESEFGYNVADFQDATQKVIDPENPDYAEGWAGDVYDGEGNQLGLVISDAPTDTFKTPALYGTWLAGLGGNTVKASTEHYVVMQNILSDQKFPGDPDALYPLDDELRVVSSSDAALNGRLVSDVITELEALPNMEGDKNGDGVIDIKDVLAPNETEITENIAVSSDYSVTVKDDGKLLYRWGNTIKKPNDVRLEATMDLPDEWSEYNPYTSLRNIYHVTEAELVVHHTITNNPNDQVRPEDFENEAAIGTLPTYYIDPAYNDDGLGPREVWLTTDAYYAGDGTLYPADTILRDEYLADQWDASDLAAIGAEDGAEGFTNAWYTTMDREPFEPVLNEDGTEYADSGPRWRLQPDKYGQDLPSVVIPDDPSDQPPPTNDEVKYEVGAETQTVLNLLDWGYPAQPLSVSAGWQDKPGDVSVNGMNYSDGFDMAVYIKGDIKPATVYSAELLMDYELVTPYAVEADVVGTDGNDFLVGIGSNAFTGGAGTDLFVLSYGSSVEGVPLTASTISDFEVGTDAIGLIGLGVSDTNFADNISQVVNGTNLEIYLDTDGAEAGADPVLIATLTDVAGDLGPSQGLVMEEDFLLANPGAGDAPVSEAPIEGTSGNDHLTGTLGDDEILGLAGNDTIYGLSGDDTIDGGAGFDLLYGGVGADTFVFADGTNVDMVYDFDLGVDSIQLSGFVEGDVSVSEYGSIGTLLTAGDDYMILRGVDVADFNAEPDVFIPDNTLMA